MSDITTEASTRASVDTNLQNQVNSLNSSVSNGKNQVANAITGKGVAASGSDSFATLASKISQIATGIGLSNMIAYGAGHDVYREVNITRKCNVIGLFENNCAEFGILDPSEEMGKQYTMLSYVGRTVIYGGVTYNYYHLGVSATMVEGYYRASSHGYEGTAYGYLFYV